MKVVAVAWCSAQRYSFLVAEEGPCLQLDLEMV